jgi:hypothetical protein
MNIMKKIKLFISVIIISAFVLIPATGSAINKIKVGQHLELGTEHIESSLVGPNGGFMTGRKISVMNSLIQFRENFIVEMIASLDDF